MKKFYITTPIYYVNDRPHVGHLYTTMAADILARYHRACAEEVFLVTGTDDNAQKNMEAATKAGKPVAEYVSEMSAVWEQTWRELGISFDSFIRTSSKEHIAAVGAFFKKVETTGDIYKGMYEGAYCTGCESFKTDTELVDGKCPLHNRVPESVKQENYFFRVSKYRDALLDHISTHPEFIEPSSRRNEVTNFIKDHLEDFSISRPNNGWGIPVPGDDAHTLYVWFDALINYVSAVGYGSDEAQFKKLWPADLHLVGKDIIKFHCAYWPAMLMAAGLPLPKQVFAHGFFTNEGQKISKSLGNAIDPIVLVKEYGIETVRWYLTREIAFGEDGDFSIERLKERYNAELSHGIGNLVSRTLGMAEQYLGGVVPGHTAEDQNAGIWKEYMRAMDEHRFDKAAGVIRDYASSLDNLIALKQPWVLKKEGKNKEIEEVLYTVMESLRHLGHMLRPFMPQTAQGIFDRLGISDQADQDIKQAQKWGLLAPGTKITKGTGLFPPLAKE